MLEWAAPESVDTPALVVDLDTLVANIERMASRMAARGVSLRPHTKTHKSVDIAALQVANGALGLTAASIGEAEVLAAAGFDDLFIAYPIVAAREKARRLARLAERTTVAVGVDSVEAGRLFVDHGLARALSLTIEIDTGQHRSGVPPSAAAQLAVDLSELGLRVDGVFTHAGQSYWDPDAPDRIAKEEAAMLAEAVERMASRGVVAHRVSAGATPTAVASAVPPVNEERPGTYVFNDRQQVGLGSAARADVALAVVATVVSTSVPGQAVIDAGSKALAADHQEWLDGFGVVPELGDAKVVRMSECHGVVALGDQPKPAIGTLVRVVPNHACPTVNLFDHYDVVRDGTVIDHWPVSARGHLA
ncbi:MAG TPA: alanine racemase [Acidimicrobiales bacterium]|nr:alanine racemase [Acidimicrobiales bacterium]